jgi:dTDP-4-amino-4,6-dideoxygalactose transaminase
MSEENKNFVPFSPPDIGEAEINEVVDTLRSGWITTGPKTKLFEARIAEYCGTDRVACLSSCTAGLELVLRLLGIGSGDEVITTAYTYTASASVVTHVGATLVLVDTSPESFEMDYSKLTSVITEKTKAIIAVDLAGVICDYDLIFEAVESKKEVFQAKTQIQEALGRVAVVSDAAHALGATWHGNNCGNIADFTAFSFHAVKNLTTGEGGAVTWRNIKGIDNEEIYHQFQLYSLHGQSKDAFSKNQVGAWEYDIVAPYYKANMTDIMASIGLAQLGRYEQILSRRREIVKRYDDMCNKLGLIHLVHSGLDFQSSAHLYLIRLPGKTVDDRNELIAKMASMGVACNVHYKPLPMMTAYRNLGFDISDFPNAFGQYENEITIPLFSVMSDDQVGFVINFLEELWKG